MATLLKSKKFWVTVLGAVGAVTAGTQDQPWYVVLSLGIGAAAYTIGQGFADQGKEAAKLGIEAAVRGAAEARKRAEDATAVKLEVAVDATKLEAAVRDAVEDRANAAK